MILQVISLLTQRKPARALNPSVPAVDGSPILIFHKVSRQCSKIVTEAYSTSFSSAIRLLHKDLQEPVYNIYGFVRFADEIVDTFHDYDKAFLFAEFKKETYRSIDAGISLNPILHSFQETVRKYNIDMSLVDAFFNSMEMDLSRQSYEKEEYNEYIYGSAEVVGLMCLHVFCENNKALFAKLKAPAQSLGAAFQKVNFLRDVSADYTGLSRTYFPGVDFENFTSEMKIQIENEIANDLAEAYKGLIKLPWKARFGVYVAYKYYLTLFMKIKSVEASLILKQRVRIPDYTKLMILVRARLKNQLKLI